jgi:hypothetical protein
MIHDPLWKLVIKFFGVLVGTGVGVWRLAAKDFNASRKKRAQKNASENRS